MKVAVIAHAGKSFGGGLPELRRVLEAEGFEEPFWVEVPKSKKAPAQVQRALDEGAELIFAWGGDGMVQRCVDVLAGSNVGLAIVPAGTANLFASNLGIPQDIEKAVAIGLRGGRRQIDVGTFNGERFAVMAGAGFDAAMIRDAGDSGLKDRFGRAAYVWTGAKNLRLKPFGAKIEVDGAEWFKGKATCILLGNVGKLFGGLEAFEDARADDGKLEVGVVTADGVLDWSRMITRAVAGSVTQSPFAQTTKARDVKVKLSRKVVYELDGGDRTKVKSFKVKVEPGQSASASQQPERNSMSEIRPAGELRHAKSAGEGFVNSAAFEWLSRAGFVARAAIYAIIGVLAFKLAIGSGGKLTNQHGALSTVANQPFGSLLLTLLAIGLGGYALWRLFRAALGRGPEGSDSGFERLAALASGLAYGALCVLAVEILVGSGSSSSSTNPSSSAAGILGWPGGPWIVGAAGLVMIGVALYQAYKGITRKFLDDSKTEEMSPGVRKWIARVGTVGHLARAVVFGLIGVFLVKAAIDYDPKTAVGLDGALAKLANQPYGSVLLGTVAVGLIAFALYSLSDARYRKI